MDCEMLAPHFTIRRNELLGMEWKAQLIQCSGVAAEKEI